jgi:5-methylcytosine-specific restriction endonuclease McrA
MDDLTVDHVIPLSRWKTVSHPRAIRPNSWENQVCACKHCNTLKGNKLVTECGLKLFRSPAEPKYMPYLVISRQKANKYGWIEFLKYNVRIVDIIDTI